MKNNILDAVVDTGLVRFEASEVARLETDSKPSLKVNKDLQNLLPRAVQIDETQSPRAGGMKAGEFAFNAEAVADANLAQLASERNDVGVITVSAGPWEEGTIIDGVKRNKLVNKFGYFRTINAVVVRNLTEAKRLRWQLNVSIKRNIPPYLVVKSFLQDADFRRYFDELAKVGRQKMSAGGKAKGRMRAAVPFNRELVAAQFCGVRPWDFRYSKYLYKMETTLESGKPYSKMVKDTIIKAELGLTSPKSAAGHVKATKERSDHHSKYADLKALESVISDVQLYTEGDEKQGKVYQGDALEVMASMPTDLVNRIITSPYYFGADITYGKDWKGADTWEEYCVWTRRWLTEAWRILKTGGMLIVNTQDMSQPIYYDHRNLVMGIMMELGCEHPQPKIWYKQAIAGKKSAHGSVVNPRNRPAHEDIMCFQKGMRKDEDGTAGAIMQPDGIEISKWSESVWVIPSGQDKCEVKHPCIWPPELAYRMACYGAKIGDIVLDPFCGSGSGLYAAEKSGQTALGIEQHSVWADRSRTAIDRGRKEFNDGNSKAIVIKHNDPDF